MCKLTSKDSIFKLIIALCLPKMKAELEDIRLQVQKLENVNDVACYYAKEGKVIELAILLMVAFEKVIDQTTIQMEDNLKTNVTFRQFINMELALLIDMDYRLMDRKTEEEKRLCELCKRRMSAIIRCLPLLEIFEKAGFAIEEYLKERQQAVQNEEVVRDIVRLFADAGIILRAKDTEIDNILDSLTEMDSEGKECTIREIKNITGFAMNVGFGHKALEFESDLDGSNIGATGSGGTCPSQSDTEDP